MTHNLHDVVCNDCGARAQRERECDDWGPLLPVDLEIQAERHRGRMQELIEALEQFADEAVLSSEHPIEEIDQALREAGADPDEIGRQGLTHVQLLMQKRHRGRMQERARIVAILREEEQRLDAEPVRSAWAAHCYTAADVATIIGNLADRIEGGG